MTRAREWTRAHADVVVLVLVAAIVVGSALRIVGLTWGLPSELHPDEHVIVRGALDLARRHSFEPKYFMRPDHVEIQLSYLAYQLLAHLCFHMGVGAAYVLHPGAFLLVSRLITAIFGIAMILLAYFIGRRFDRRVGAIAAVLFALSPVMVRHSHYATPDIPLSCMLMISVLALMHYIERPRLVSLLVACAAVAVGIAIKYPAAIATLLIATVVIIAAVRDRDASRILGHGALAVAAVVGFLFAVSPVLFTKFHEVHDALFLAANPDHPGGDGLSWAGNLGYYAWTYFSGTGILLAVAAVIGLVAAVRTQWLQTVPLALGFVYWALLSTVPLHWERWGLPMFITPLILAAIGLLHAWEWAAERRWRRSVSWVVGVLVVANLTMASVAIDASLLAPDTRFVARRVLLADGITKDVTSYEGYSPFRLHAPRTVFRDFTTVDGRRTPLHPRHRYLLLSGCMRQRFEDNPRFVRSRLFYRDVEKQFRLVKSWSAVEPASGWGVEPIDIVRSAVAPIDYLRGKRAGCDVDVYATQ